MRYLVCLLLAGCAADPAYERALAAYGPWCERFYLSGTQGYNECIIDSGIRDREQPNWRK